MTFEHIIYIPGVLLVGLLLGYVLGARAVRERGLFDDTKEFVRIVLTLYGSV